MEIFILVLLYYFSQNPQFAESVKPLMAELKNSQQMLCFLEDLSKFTQTFSAFQSQKKEPCNPQDKPHEHTPCNDDKHAEKEKEKPQSPTQGIADEFIEQLLNQYLTKR